MNGHVGIQIKICFRFFDDKPNLECGTVFIRFYIIPSTKSIDVTCTIIKALQENKPSIDLKKCTNQTYDVVSNM